MFVLKVIPNTDSLNGSVIAHATRILRRFAPRSKWRNFWDLLPFIPKAKKKNRGSRGFSLMHLVLPTSARNGTGFYWFLSACRRYQPLYKETLASFFTQSCSPQSDVSSPVSPSVFQQNDDFLHRRQRHTGGRGLFPVRHSAGPSIMAFVFSCGHVAHVYCARNPDRWSAVDECGRCTTHPSAEDKGRLSRMPSDSAWHPKHVTDRPLPKFSSPFFIDAASVPQVDCYLCGVVVPASDAFVFSCGHVTHVHCARNPVRRVATTDKCDGCTLPSNADRLRLSRMPEESAMDPAYLCRRVIYRGKKYVVSV
jgi:hypothetical protein